MTGLLRPDAAFVAVNSEVARALGTTTASVLGYIAYVEDQDGAQVSAKAISDGTGVPVRSVQRAVTRLREQGIVTSERAGGYIATNVYRVVWQHPVIAGHPHTANVAASTPPERRDGDRRNGGIFLPSEQIEGQEPTAATAPGPETPTEESPAMTVPASYQEPLLPAVGLTLVTEDSGPPKTAQTLVARWCDGYRASNGHDAPGPLMKRVAGQMKNLAKSCGTDHDDWVAAYGAAYRCGTAGAADAVRFMSAPPARRGRTTNAFASPELGGPPGAAAALLGLTGPRALGGPA